ncbi:DNA binding protein [Erwinia phage vB_EamM-Bue1]|uniref:DNA-binding protein HBsu n=2 Tax=Nezavisimistyvirus TaxID=2841279 RepID=A0A0A0YVH6_9CAUD|nr:DNA binding protein [Erwinia phage phiEa2809]YP_009837688.1 DNA binding protein [Erwinia phage vB_EamM-Bue1]AIX13086.1 DNA-binding protein HBsu [Erwinia phage phiEa2809]AVO22929.1 DNA-binding protein HU-beta [Erwinia phage vB_EamM-Bue1]
MSKQALIEAIAATGVTKTEAEKAIKLVTDGITSELQAGRKVQLIGFGTFEPRHQAERQGRNPSNGQAITIAASIKPAFSAGEKLKAALNK